MNLCYAVCRTENGGEETERGGGAFTGGGAMDNCSGGNLEQGEPGKEKKEWKWGVLLNIFRVRSCFPRGKNPRKREVPVGQMAKEADGRSEIY